MARITEDKGALIDSIMGYIGINKKSITYKIVKKALHKLAVYELSSIILAFELSNKEGGDK